MTKPLIELDAAIAALHKEWNADGTKGERRVISSVVDTLRALPTVQPEPAPADPVAEAALVLDMHKLANRLVPLYRKDAVKIADLCDETLDPSGALLGFVRDAALRAIVEASHAE